MKKYLKEVAATVSVMGIFISAFASTIGGPGQGPTPPSFLLSLAEPISSRTIIVDNNQKFDVKVLNLLPNGSYAITINTVTTVQPALVAPGAGAAANALVAGACPGDWDTTLGSETSESDFASALQQASTDCPAMFAKYTTLSTKDLGKFSLNNQSMTITITSLAQSKATWTYTFQTKDQGQWLTTWGFTFIPYTWGKPHTYYAIQDPINTAQYKITVSTHQSAFQFAPTVMFHYMWYSDGAVSVSPTGGLGINITTATDNSISPLVFFGVSFLYKANVGLSIGIAGHTVDNLKGNYDTSTPIATNLSQSDLNQQVVVINPFVSLTLRFGGSHPYASKSSQGIAPSN